MKVDTDFELFYDLQLVSEDGLAGCSVPNGPQGGMAKQIVNMEVEFNVLFFSRRSFKVGPILNSNVMVQPNPEYTAKSCPQPADTLYRRPASLSEISLV